MADSTNSDNQDSSSLIGYKKLIILVFVFLALIFILRKITLSVCAVITFDCPGSFPISIFHFIFPTPQRIFMALAILILFAFLVFYLEKINYRFPHIIFAAVLLVVGSNLIQGWSIGLYAPVSGSAYTGELVAVSDAGQEYYHDVIRIKDPARVFLNYNQFQTTFNQHTHTHPPGTLLLMYVLIKLLGNPALVSLFIAVVSVSLSSYFFYKLLILEVDSNTARFVTFLFALLPAVQIYYLATIDALIASLLLGTIYCFVKAEERKYLFLSAAFLITTFTLTFVSLFILPVIALFDLIKRRSLTRASFLFAVLIAAHLIFYLLFDYNALQSFRTASAHENPQGFMLFVNPVNYFFTRLEDVAELSVFFGPLLILLLLRGIKIGLKFRQTLFTLSLIGISTLSAMFVTGAFRTGETARASIFIFPYLMLPVALYLDSIELNCEKRLGLAGFVFAQTIIMQMIGNYFY